MFQYVDETYKIFPDDLGGEVTTPAVEHLRDIVGDNITSKTRKSHEEATFSCHRTLTKKETLI